MDLSSSSERSAVAEAWARIAAKAQSFRHGDCARCGVYLVDRRVLFTTPDEGFIHAATLKEDCEVRPVVG